MIQNTISDMINGRIKIMTKSIIAEEISVNYFQPSDEDRIENLNCLYKNYFASVNYFRQSEDSSELPFGISLHL